MRWWITGALTASVSLWSCQGGELTSEAGRDAGEQAAGGGGGQAGAGGGGGGTPGVFRASQTIIRRLSQAELDKTLEVILGDETRPARRLLPEDDFFPFDNHFRQHRPSQALIDAMSVLAEEVATRAISPEARGAWLPCEPEGFEDAACLQRVGREVGQRLLRRPLTETELTSLVDLVLVAQQAEPALGADVYTGLSLMLQALLLDPECLYLVEGQAEVGPDGVQTLGDYAIAARMAYLIQGGPPDEALMQAAAEGLLSDPDTRRAEAGRLLDTPAARQQAQRFHAMWLGYRAIPHGPDLVAAFNTETTALLDRVIFEGTPNGYLDLFTATETYVDAELAAHYDLPAPEMGAGWVAYPEASGRGGILSHGAVLAAHSKGFSDSSPTQRGKFIRERLMCSPVAPPPPDLDVDEPPGDAESECKQARYEAHMNTPGCVECHSAIDPLGFGLENYDLAGRFRAHDEGLPDCVIDGVGTLPGGETFKGPAELGARLVAEGHIERCTAEHFYTFAIGRPLATSGEPDWPAILELTRAFADSGFDFRALIEHHVASEAFALRKVTPVEEE